MFKFFCFLLFIQIHIVTPFHSPVLIWGTNCPVNSKPALRAVKMVEFSDVVGTLLANHMLVVLQEENLDPSDFQCRMPNTKSTCFKFLETVTPKIYYAKVEEPMQALAQRNVTIVKHYVRGRDCLKCKATCEVGTIQLLKLIANRKIPREVNLEMHDEFISRLQNTYAKDCPISYMYMSASASTELITENEQMSLLERVRVRRSPLFSGRMLLYARKFYWSKSDDAGEFQPTTLNTNENNNKIIATVSATDNNFEFHIELKTSSYALKHVTHNDQVYWVHHASAPMKFSYYCKTLKAYGKNNILYIEDFQMEIAPDSSEIRKFSSPWKCESLFSPGLLMAYFSTAILLCILFFGICMIMDIKSNDKMDDQNGPRLPVNMN